MTSRTTEPGTPRLVQESSSARGFVAELEQVAQTDVTVLIEGEAGSGKSLAAAHLHRSSARAAGPFVDVSIAALAPTLVESELFGHEVGAFTGARSARVGRFRSAEGGTLVLEGIEGLSLDHQAKLLRVLQEKVVEPLGADGPQPIDVRVVATSTHALGGLVEQGRFREDLYYRIAVVTLRVPPLRSRVGDLEGLVADLGARVAARAGVPLRPLSGPALEILTGHAWPGNVRELENALERVMVLRPSDEASQPVAADELAFLEDATRGAAGKIARDVLARGLTLDELTYAVMEEAVREHRGNLSAAARSVGLSRRAFDYRRKKLIEERGANASGETEGS